MQLMHWISKLVADSVSRLFGSENVNTAKAAFEPRLRRVEMLALILCAGLLLFSAAGTALAQPQKAMGSIVAAGFGYQSGETSTITVKTYDAATGETLSDESFDLTVKEDGTTASTPSARIFAGGVGHGATDLSNFVLRVYDAKTGAFQWEGQLNLTPRSESGSGHLVSTLVPRRATVTKVHSSGRVPHQPLFLLRALDSLTGGLVWQDEFSTEGRKLAQVERIADVGAGLETENSPVSHTFDFRIRMFEADGRTMAWEDQFAQMDTENETSEAAQDRAQFLQAWPDLTEGSAEPAEI